MSTLFMLVIMIPVVAVATKFWVDIAKWGIRNHRSLADRVQKIRSAFAEGNQEVE